MTSYKVKSSDSHCPQQTRFFPSVKIMIDEINKILDIEKTKELAWW